MKNERKNTENTEKKMTIYEYEQKYVKRQNGKGAAIFVKAAATVIGILLFACLFNIAYNVYTINKYAGYAACAVCLIIFIVFYIVPIVKILKTDYFQTNVNSQHAREAKRHNRAVRRSISEKIIDFNASVDGAGWYEDEAVVRLEYALKTNDDEGIKRELTVLYGGSVKSSARSVIGKYSLRAGMYSAMSQSNTVDAALITVVNLQMIKDIVFLYGFRPSDARLARIFARVIQNSLISYGLGSYKIGSGVVKTIGGAAKSIPILGSAISVLVDSSVQGLTNAALTAVIGYQTIKYLNYEYRLQDILDGVEIDEGEEAFESTIEEVKTELKEERKRQDDRKKQKAVV